ncbi:MAG: hypothetical protein M3082_01960 [Candidatus Dormibacteraeota bacterium]|nr:hypothetical protein [Candidatus Dormibacteraeota bacterium]MDQ6917721.1 hypothetical protein [Candidatus Dormibacteraeota bacterium]
MPTDPAIGGRRPLSGNRLALVGAVLYFLEWVAILGFGAGAVPADPGTSAKDIVAEYSQHATAIALAAGWYSLVLPGRILFVAAVKDGLRRSGAGSILADFAVGAMTLSVALEVSAFMVAAGAGHAATHGADQSTILGLDAAANWLDLALAAPVGLSVLGLSVAMLWSRAFWTWLCWLGIAAGVVGCVHGVIAGAAFDKASFYGVADSAAFIGVLAAWLWIIVTAIVLFRARGQKPVVAA